MHAKHPTHPHRDFPASSPPTSQMYVPHSLVVLSTQSRATSALTRPPAVWWRRLLVWGCSVFLLGILLVAPTSSYALDAPARAARLEKNLEDTVDTDANLDPDTVASIATSLPPLDEEIADDPAQLLSRPLGIISSFERIRLPDACKNARVSVYNMIGRIGVLCANDTEFKTSKYIKPDIEKSVCPQIVNVGSQSFLQCKNRKIDAQVFVEPKGVFLEIWQLHGASLRDGAGGPPHVFHDPTENNLGGACPGTTFAGKGECVLAKGDIHAAEKFFLQALSEPLQQKFALLRLGDLRAWAGRGDEAARFYQEITATGPVGRLAYLRMCQLRGNCVDPDRIYPIFNPFDASALPASYTAEVDMFAARAYALNQKAHLGAKRILAGQDEMRRRDSQMLSKKRSALEKVDDYQFSPCRFDENFCLALAHAAFLDEPTPDNAYMTSMTEPLGLYLQLPNRFKSDFAVELARLAARDSENLGGYLFAASTLSAVTSRVPQAELEEHLLRCTELYVAGGAPTRAQIPLDYANNRVKQRDGRLQTRWREVLTHLKTPEPTKSQADLQKASLADDMKLAQDLLAQIRASQQQPTPTAPTP